MKHVLIVLQWQKVNEGQVGEENLWRVDPSWVFLRSLAHGGQPVEEITPEPNGFTQELIVTDATYVDMQTNPLCVVIWAEDWNG